MSKPVIPANPEAEDAVLNALLMGTSPDAAPLCEAHFSAPDKALIFAACRDLAEQRVPVDIQSVRSLLTSRGQLYHAGGDPSRFLVSAISGESALRHYYGQLEDARQARAVALYVRAHLDDLTALRLPAPRFVEELNELSAPKASALYLNGSAIITELEEAERTGKLSEAFGFGLPELDERIKRGVMREELCVVAADTGRGKSALMIQCLAEAAKAGTPALYISLELPAAEVWNRAVSAASRHAQGTTAFRQSQCEAESWPLFVASNVAELSAIGALIRAAVRKEKVALVAVDYLQIIESPGDSRENKMSEAARYLKALASTENVAIITASQVNEDGRLRESRAIGHHANLVLAIGDGEIECRKFRRGPWQWSVPANLKGAVSRFFPSTL
jgi:replicative DNA helicase